MGKLDPSEISDWLTDAAAGGATRVDLHRVFGGKREERITAWGDLGDLAALGARILRTAERDGRGVEQGARVDYVLVATRSTDGEEVHTLRLSVPSGAVRTPDHAAIEVRDMGGVASHALSQLTQMASELIKATGQALKAAEGRDRVLLEQLEHTSAQLARVEGERELSVAAQQKFLLFEREQMMLANKTARDEERDRVIFEKLSAWGPMILNRLLGGGPGKGAPAADAMFTALCKSFSQRDVEVLMNMPISDEKKILFGELYQSVMQREAAAEPAAAPAQTPLNGAAERKPS